MSSVSVVIPCYKYGHFLEEAVSSVLDDQEGAFDERIGHERDRVRKAARYQLEPESRC